MRIGRAIIIPAILVLSSAGSILAGSVAPVAAAQVSNANMQSTTTPLGTGVYYHA
jgi:hypothetical protein